MVLSLLAAGMVPLADVHRPLFAGFGLVLSGFCACRSFVLGALHLPRRWHMLLAFAAPFLSTGIFEG